MKKTTYISNFICILILLCAFPSAKAQTPSWQWAKKSVGASYYGSRCIASDNNGNTYSAGTYTSSTLQFDNLTVTNLSTNSNLREGYVVKHNALGDAVWLINVGGIGEEQIFDIATDNNNNVYITGDFDSPTLTFGSTTLVNAGNQDVFIAKFDSNGTPLWAKSITGQKYDYGYALTVDSSNNVYVGGVFASDTINAGGTILTNVEATLADIDHDVFFAKYDSAGNILWAKSTGGTGFDNFSSMTTDSSGNLYLFGYFYSPSITFGTTTLYNTNNYGDLFICKYNSSGTFQWAKKAGGTNYDYARSIKADNSGNVYIAGHFDSPSLTFGSTVLTNAGSSNVFLAKYDTSGAVVWAKKAGNAQTNIAYDLCLDTNNNIFITGFYNSSIAFGNLPTHTTQGSNDIFVCKYDTNGQALWSKSNGGTGFDVAMAISCSPNNELSITGYMTSTSIGFDNTTINTITESLFVAKMPGTLLGTEDFKTTKFSIFPNPVENVLSIKKDNRVTAESYIIYDINGRSVLKGNLNETNNIDTASLERGFYTICIDDNFTTKFIKK